MTKQEAIETIKLALSQVEWDYPLNYAAAFDMAISAMEKQDVPDTNADTISRQEAVDALIEEFKRIPTVAIRAKCTVEKLPPAQPYSEADIQKMQDLEQTEIQKAYELGRLDAEPQWTPCSEGLPKTNGIYNVTRNMSDGFESFNITDTCYFDGSNTWHDDTRVNHERKYLTDVVAWCELPEPYKEEGEK